MEAVRGRVVEVLLFRLILGQDKHALGLTTKINHFREQDETPMQKACVYVRSYQRAKSNDLEDRFHEEEDGEHNIEVLQDDIVLLFCIVELQPSKN